MSDVIARLAESERDRTHPNIRPRDAATLIVIDRSGDRPRVLMGRRHAGHKFMPGKFVFPGGRAEPYDGRMPAVGALAPEHEARLLKAMRRPSPARARALALAAIRETCEEVGLLLGRRSEAAPQVPAAAWQPFADARVVPDLTQIHFVARAITPPRRNRRFDARFFAIDAEAISHRLEGVVGPETELDEIVWVPIAEAKRLDLPTITQVIVEQLEFRIAQGFAPSLPVPFFHMRYGRFVREWL
ncbi:MAG TPA: NUDIX hydrolase [Xanthobacteraceae bacterium]|nr:NUDIX hydrolase [Xanthobacteraceae bacterium]